MKNRFLLHDHKNKNLNGEFCVDSPECLDDAVLPYFGRVLYRLNQLLDDSGITFVVTTFNVSDLPVYGPHVVPVILEDELSREPRYRNRVGAIFRCYPNLPSHLEGIRGLKLLHRLGGSYVVTRDFLRDGTGRLGTLKMRLMNAPVAPIFEIPIGCNAYADVDFIPFEERDADVFFCGSISHLGSQRASSLLARLRPKSLERLQMKDALDALVETHPEVKVNHSFTASFEESVSASRLRYLSGMMNTRFCLAPRGGVPLTYRFYEAVRYGTIPIGETFPDDYSGAPFVRLEDWKDLPDVLPEVLKDKERILEMHRAGIAWWEENASEEVTAQLMKQRLEETVLEDLRQSDRQEMSAPQYA